jgi:uncharacterized protein (UPF0333 family)
MSETKRSYEFITVFVCGTIVAISGVISTLMYNINDRNNMSKNIEAAITKGVDPLSVKCAYEVNPNAICITYAATATKK